MECFGLKDDLLNIKGNNIQDIYSRVTNVSKTRIDFILSRAYKSVYGLEIPKYRLITDPYLKKIQTKYGLYLTEIQT